MALYSFTNGSSIQRSRWEQAAHLLLNLPIAAIPLAIEVSFESSVAGGHTDLAVTDWTYNSPKATTAVRSDAPSFGTNRKALEAEAASLGLAYSVEKFYTETAAHELGHALFAALPEQRRVAIARMFGAASDDIEELQPEDKPWQDRIMEGIAETFKEAFLPRRHRVFGNRTRRQISYSRYPEFRKLFRDGIEVIPSEGGYDHDVLELDSADLRVAWPLSKVFENVGSPNEFGQFYRAGYNLFVREIPTAHTFNFSFMLPKPNPVVAGIVRPTLIGWRYRISVNGVVVDKFRGLWGYGRPDLPLLSRFLTNYYRAASLEWDAPGDQVATLTDWYTGRQSVFVENENEMGSQEEEGWTDNTLLFEDAISAGLLPVTLSSSIAVSPGDSVTIHARAIGAEYATPGGPNFEEEALAVMGWMQPYGENLPLMHYFEPGTGGGVPIERPSGLVVPGGNSSGVHPSLHGIVGRRG